MSGMNHQLDLILGYRDGYIASPDSRAIYACTWNAFNGCTTAWLNPLANKVVMHAPKNEYQRGITEIVDALFKRVMK